MSASRKRVAAALGLSVAVTGLSISAMPVASAVSTGLVINEVFGGGGNSGANLNADFVELFNPTDAAISLAGTSLQYRSSAGTGAVNGIAPLSGEVPAGDTYLIQTSVAGANGAALPTPDLTVEGINMAGANGTVFLATQTTAVTLPAVASSVVNNAAITDLVGFGATNTYETAPTAPTSVTTGAARTSADNDDNGTEFVVGAQTPTASDTGAEEEPPPVDADEVAIADIQGSGPVSPLAGEVVTTEGVVTATYATGGLNGFYIQTEGTGGADDTPGSSDAVFVFGASVDETTLALGDLVEVTGTVSEFATITQVTPATADDVVILDETATEVVPLATTVANTEAGREAHEGELVAPQGAFTVTNTFSTNGFGDIGIAKGTTPLIQPTEVADAQDTQAIDAIVADNARRSLVLDDGASINYLSQANKRIPLPWLSPTTPVRVGDAVTFTQPVILEFRNSSWKFQPTEHLTATGTPPATFEKTRTTAPEEVGGDISLATFNVLNYFATTAEEFVDGGGTCTTYNDRFGNPITANQCTPDGPRGAANQANLERQQAKIVAAINALDASVVSLEEIENSVKLGKDRDFALSTLVDALNEAAGADTWAFAPSPAPADMPTPAQEDVIRTAFIYKPAAVELVGPSQILIDETNFGNAREPLAQAFKAAGGADADAFLAIVNHFKSKGSGADDGTGQGNANPDRIGQANALSAFAETVSEARGTDAVFLLGDFNSYSMEDPMQVLYEDGYTAVESDDPSEETYSFSGLSGSLDHVLASNAALEMVTGADVWSINSGESLAYEYSRFNSNATNFYSPDVYRASDHDPAVVGLDLRGVGLAEIQIIGTNDYHGRLAAAPALAGAVKQLRAQNQDTVFAAAGDIIGATTFESFIADDKPTIDVMNEAGLEVSAVGNHEFDKGFDDLKNRVMAPYDAQTNAFGGAEWEYLGANVKFKADGSDALEGTWIKEMNGVSVGFVGAVTEQLPSLVSPAGIAEIEATDIVAATNTAADDLMAEGADVIVLLVHEGAGGTDCETMDDDATSDFGSIIAGVNDNVDAIISGHTHLAYSCEFEVPGWVGRDVTTRPVVSAGQYGTNLNKLVFTVDAATGDVQAKTQEILALPGSFPVDPATKTIVDDAIANAAVLGGAPLGELAGGFNRAKFEGGAAENRGGESTLGNLVAEVQQWATETPEAGAAQIAFMNPGGLRQDMVGLVGDDGTYPRTLTYKQAADVQSFANTLVNMDMTGAVIAQVLEQQWQPAGSTRPFLRLGVSEGFTYTYDPDAPAGSRILSMELDGEPIDPSATYSVTANSFLAGGGDNFGAFNSATGKADTGKIDLQAMVDYMDEFANTVEGDAPLAVDYAQRAVGVNFADGSPAEYEPGDEVTFDLSSLSMAAPSDVRDTTVTVSLDGVDLETAPVTTTLSAPGNGNSNDEAGTASVSITLPVDVASGQVVLMVTGNLSGTVVEVPVTVADDAPAEATVTATATPGAVDVKAGTSKIEVSVASAGENIPTGTVSAYRGSTLLATALLADGTAMLRVGPFDRVGTLPIEVRYSGDDLTAPATEQLSLTVRKQTPRMNVAAPSKVKKNRPISVRVVARADQMTVTGKVRLTFRGKTVTRRLDDGRVIVPLGRFTQTGRVVVKVTYLGNSRTNPVGKSVAFRVVS